MIGLALLLVAVGAAGFVYRAVRGPSLADRIVALDGLVVSTLTAIVLRSVQTDSGRYVDVALVVAVVGFVATSAAARFVERRGA